MYKCVKDQYMRPTVHIACVVPLSNGDVSILKFLIEAANKEVSSKSIPHRTSCCLTWHSKPDTVEKLLQRIKDSPVGEEVIAAILASSRNLQASDSASNTVGGRDSIEHTPETRALSVAYPFAKSEELLAEHERRDGDAGSSLVSPLHILADAVETERLASLNILDSTPSLGQSEEPLLNEPSNAWLSRQSTERLIRYFSTLASLHLPTHH